MGQPKRNLSLTGHYGELDCPDSMLYRDGEATVLEVTLNRDYDNAEMQCLLAKIDELIRFELNVV